MRTAHTLLNTSNTVYLTPDWQISIEKIVECRKFCLHWSFSLRLDLLEYALACALYFNAMSDANLLKMLVLHNYMESMLETV